MTALCCARRHSSPDRISGLELSQNSKVFCEIKIRTLALLPESGSSPCANHNQLRLASRTASFPEGAINGS